MPGWVLALLLLLFFLLPSPQAHYYGTVLNGAGSVEAGPLLEDLFSDYHFVNDAVRFNYSAIGLNAALTRYSKGDLSFVVTATNSNVTQGKQFPLASHATVFAYNIPALNSQEPNLLLDRETAGLIWAGRITRWDDPVIKELNPQLASKLPAEPILLGITPDFSIVATALSKFSPEFVSAFESANRSLAHMPPALSGHASLIRSILSERVEWLKSHNNSMIYIDLGTVKSSGFKWVNMINKAGHFVVPTTSSIQSAMDDLNSYFNQSLFDVDLTDASGENSWPLASLLSIFINTNIADVFCTNVFEQAQFISWFYTNNAVTEAASRLGFVTMDVSWKKSLLDRVVSLQCGGQRTIDTTYLIGMGPPVTIFPSGSSISSGTESKLKYYIATAEKMHQSLVERHLDFGMTSTGATLQDFALMPLAAYGIAPGYNLPELNNTQRLVLDLSIIALIYLNKITMWNDERIQSINPPDVAACLPSKPILVIIEDPNIDGFSRIVDAAISQVDSEYAAVINSGELFPVQQVENRTIVANNTDQSLISLSSLPYSFTFWNIYDLIVAPRVNLASLINPAGYVVVPSMSSLSSALKDYDARNSDSLAYDSFLFGPGKDSWPLVAMVSFVYLQSSMSDCVAAQGLAEFFFLVQTNPTAQEIFARHYLASATTVNRLKVLIFNEIANFTCNGEPMSSAYGCIDSGMLCSGNGVCTNHSCVCSPGNCGTYCNTTCSSTPIWTIILSILLPSALVLLLMLGILILICFIMAKKKKAADKDWEIDFDELVMGHQLGLGGYGEVFKAEWKGTEVAVKMLASDVITREMIEDFKAEVRLMTTLRHPNVVLFMAASTKPPNMCIVMEYMGLGSLYDLLHNELIESIPFHLKAKMAYQSAKGMHFLHSCGIVHRDLKSLNLLLDIKWNVKVSDFGLTKFKEDLKQGSVKMVGSVHWMAPEIIMESPDADCFMADVYSFGIVLWELLTREQPYEGMNFSAVAVSVIRDGLRPQMPPNVRKLCSAEFEQLIYRSWNEDADARPNFFELMTRLSGIVKEEEPNRHLSSTGLSDFSSYVYPRRTFYSSESIDTNTLEMSYDPDLNKELNEEPKMKQKTNEIEMACLPAHHGKRTKAVVVVCHARVGPLWEVNPMATKEALLFYMQLLRAKLSLHNGQEVVVEEFRGTHLVEGLFCLNFPAVNNALDWCISVQWDLLDADWPTNILKYPEAAEELGPSGERIFRGPRVQMGVHLEELPLVHPATGKRTIGSGLSQTIEVCGMAPIGGISLSPSACQNLTAPYLQNALQFRECDLFVYRIPGLEHRLALEPNSGGRRGEGGGENTIHDPCSSTICQTSMCRWLLSSEDLTVGNLLRPMVHCGRWKGIEVVVRMFYHHPRTLSERCLLEFQAEVGVLCNIHHPNVVLFIGGCLQRQNLCVVREYLKQGTLRDCLSDSMIELCWPRKLRLLQSAACGLCYLHSLSPPIFHRNLTSNSLLLDENWNVKVADFGFSRIDKESKSLTGTYEAPFWTAPEVLQGSADVGTDEKVDVFAFGMIMWEVLTRRLPFDGSSFIKVALELIAGFRPTTASDRDALPQWESAAGPFRRLVERSWHSVPALRPTMGEIYDELGAILRRAEESNLTLLDDDAV